MFRQEDAVLDQERSLTDGMNATANPIASYLDRAGLRGPLMKYWYLYVGSFYLVWLVLAFGLGDWVHALTHWRMAVVMVLGSVVAGSTPMGGGTVAFPVLVLLFHESASIGRNFAMAIQALGMTSAMIFILCRRTPIQFRMLVGASAGAAVGLLFGTFTIAPHLSPSVVKLLFASVWVNFGIMTLHKNKEICALDRVPRMRKVSDTAIAVLAGLLGGIINSIIGVGIEMVLYTILVLRYRCDLKAAVPTAVSMGAIASLMGIGLHALIGDIGIEVYYNWLACGPIVVFGAPFGAFLVSVIPRLRTLYFVSALCLLQFAWTLSQVAPQTGEWIFVALSLLGANAGFHGLYRLGLTKPADLPEAGS